MKLKHYALGAALCTAAAFSQNAKAAGITINDTDLLLCFQDNTQTKDLILDMGPLSSLTNGETFNLSTDLNNDFGSSGTWASDSTLIWSIVGTDENDGGSTNGNTLNYATDWIGSKSTALTEQGESTQSIPTDYVYDQTDPVLGSSSATQGSNTHAATINKTTSGSYADIYGGGGGDISGIWGSVTQQSGNIGSGSDSETLWQLEPEDTNGGTINPSNTNEGTFTLGNNGVITYATAAVPEPSTWASVILGAGALIGLRRRRRA